MPSTAPAREAGRSEALRLLGGIERHPHALAVLGPALGPAGGPSHAYLFHGPAGVGKRSIARAFAAALLAEGAADPEGVRERVMREAHPDLSWVRPSGAAEMRVVDIEEPVIAAAARTPFESARRVFVIEGAETMNDDAANRLLKTLEEPPSFVHLILLSDSWQELLPTVVSRCQRVRFDPLPAQVIADGLEGVEREQALACARLALGDAGLAARLAGEQGAALRVAAEDYIRAALARETGGRPWQGLLAAAQATRAREPGELAEQELAGELELLPARSANATNGRAWMPAGAASAERGRGRSKRACAWASCGCATCSASAKGPPRRSTPSIAARRWPRMPRSPRRPGCERRSSSSARPA